MWKWRSSRRVGSTHSGSNGELVMETLISSNGVERGIPRIVYLSAVLERVQRLSGIGWKIVDKYVDIVRF